MRKTPVLLPSSFCLAFVFLFRPRLAGAGRLTLFAESGVDVLSGGLGQFGPDPQRSGRADGNLDTA